MCVGRRSVVGHELSRQYAVAVVPAAGSCRRAGIEAERAAAGEHPRGPGCFIHERQEPLSEADP